MKKHSQVWLYPVYLTLSPIITHRRLCDEDDELSEVEPDAVPSEVRDWLALTFTRSMSNIKRRGDDKPKFRSVAHAIRAGIMVDRWVEMTMLPILRPDEDLQVLK